MSFLAPLYLMLAGAVAIPLFLHLRRRRIENKVDFPAVRYLERAEKENVRQLKVRNLLLMFLRIAAVLAIAFAAARPIGAFFGAGHVPSALAMKAASSPASSMQVCRYRAMSSSVLRCSALSHLRSGMVMVEGFFHGALYVLGYSKAVI